MNEKQENYNKLQKMVREIQDKIKEAEKFADEKGLEFGIWCGNEPAYFIGRGTPEQQFRDKLANVYDEDAAFGWSYSGLNC